MSETILPSRESQIPKPGNLVAQFMVVAGTVLIAGMLAIGLWVTSEIEGGVTDSAGAVTALYVDALIAPVAQELDNGGSLGDEARRELDFIIKRGALRDEVSAFKLWDPSGRIVFSDNPDLVGSIFDVSDGLAQALAGRVDAALARQSHTVSDIARNAPLLEVYSPVRSATTGRIIAVAEFYTTAERLREHLFDARVKSWFVVGLVSLGMFSALYALFARGNRTISLQRRALDGQIDQLSALLEQNTGLTQRLEQANHRIALPAAWLMTRTDIRFKKVLSFLMALPLAMPCYVMAYALLGLSGYGLCANGSASRCRRSTAFWGAGLALSLYTFPCLFLHLRAAFLGMDSALEESAQCLGRRQSEIFRRTILPLLWPALVASWLIVGLYVVGDFP